MRGTALALALACLVLLVLAREGKGEGKGEGNTVRLCGRDFVRAVVFTCGGSRWRRHLSGYPYLSADSEKPQPFPHEGDADFSSSPEQRLGIHSKETQDVKREQDLQNTGEISVLNRREAAKLLTTSCCTVGCSRTEISSLC